MDKGNDNLIVYASLDGDVQSHVHLIIYTLNFEFLHSYPSTLTTLFKL
jgi:hypothetical protein